jgi:hypothetical protein
MSNPMRYIKDLEAVGFQRDQAEAQVKMVFDVIERDLATKSDIALLKSDIAVFRSDLAVFTERVENRLHQFENRLHQSEERTERRFIETEFRLMTRLSLLAVSCTSIAIAALTWLIKI